MRDASRLSPRHVHVRERRFLMSGTLTYREVGKLTGLSRSTITRRVRAGAFPAPVNLGFATPRRLHCGRSGHLAREPAARRVSPGGGGVTLDAEQVVYDAGGRMVVLRPAGKIPAWRGYLTNRRPSPSTVGDCLLAGCGVGIVPGSIRSAVLDLDGGQDPAALWREAGEGWLRLPTHRGEHRYFDATGQVTKLPWAAFGCYGDLVEASGYVMLHRDGLQVLAEALPHRKAAPLGQLDLFLNSSRRERFRKAEVDTVRVVVPPGTIIEEVPRRSTLERALGRRPVLGLPTVHGGRPRRLDGPCAGLRGGIERPAPVSDGDPPP